MRTDKLIKLIKEAALDHFHQSYKKSMAMRGRYRASRKLAEEDGPIEEPKSKKKTDTGVDRTPNEINTEPVLSHSIMQQR